MLLRRSLRWKKKSGKMKYLHGPKRMLGEALIFSGGGFVSPSNSGDSGEELWDEDGVGDAWEIVGNR